MALDLNPKKGQAGFTRLALFIFIILTCSHNAKAATGDHGAGLGLGQVLLLGDLSGPFNDSIGLHGIYSYEASALLGLYTHVHYSSHSNVTNTNSLTIKGLVPNMRVNLAYIDKLVVYGFTGFGFYMIDQTIGEQVGSVMTVGFDMGAAVAMSLTDHLQFGTELSFNNIFSKTDPATATGTSSGMSIGGSYIGLFLNVMYIF